MAQLLRRINSGAFSEYINSLKRFHTQNVRYSQQLNEQPENRPHLPVMAEEVLKYMDPSAGETFVDMTFGAGGHATKLLESAPDIKIFALDRDPVAYNYAKGLADKYPDQIVPLLGRFSELPELLKEHRVKANSIDGFLFDFGCSSMQFDIAERGFSISKNGPLDMRMDGFRCPDQPTAADVLARANVIDLERILKIYGEEKQYKKIARAIHDARFMFKKLETTSELAELVDSVLLEDYRTDQLGRFSHKATKTFQALRIFVNNELNEINYGILIAQQYLKISGHLITISFHSLEDKIIKRHLTGHVTENVANTQPLKFSNYDKCFNEEEVAVVTGSPWMMLHKHVLTPSFDEIDNNPRSRSAKFRAAIKVK